MKFEHVFFDLDNTLWDHRKNAFFTIKDLYKEAKIEKQYNITFDDFHAKYYDINESLWELIRDGMISKEALCRKRFYDTFLHFGIDDERLSEYFDKRFQQELTRHNHLVDGTMEILDYLKSKSYTLHIISNGFGELTHEKIINSGIKKYFKTITSADDVGVRKPNPAIFAHALKISGAEKENSLMIGDDWIADVQGAKHFGIKPIFFDSLDNDLNEEGIASIKNLKELKNLL